MCAKIWESILKDEKTLQVLYIWVKYDLIMSVNRIFTCNLKAISALSMIFTIFKVKSNNLIFMIIFTMCSK